MKNNIFILIIIFILAPASSIANETIIKKGDTLNLDRCIYIALKMQPSIASSRYLIKLREAQLGQAKSNYFPKIDTSAGFTRNFNINNSNDPYFSMSYMTTYNRNLGTAALNQTIFDFGRTPTNVNIKRLNIDSSRFDLDDVSITVMNNVKLAYYNVLKAKRARDVNLETVRQYEQHLGNARTFFEAGKRPKYDVTKAELDLSNAKLNLISAENQLKLAWVSLNNTMGIDWTVDFQIEDNLYFKEYKITLEDALGKAYKDRPDLKSLLAQRASAEKAVELAKKEYFPQLTGAAAYNAIGSKYPLGQGWQAGLTMTMNVFDGFSTTSKVEEAVANKRKIDANIDSLKLQILLDVKQAYLNIIKALQSISTTEVQIKQAKENLELANFRYEAGLASPVEITDANVDYSNAQLANINALFEYKVAQANLEKAMGNK